MFEEIHNTTEDMVFALVNEICDSIETHGGADPDSICTCQQCRQDTACYVLNRTAPRYLVSNRGVVRVEQTTIDRQQYTADITALIWEGLKRVHHNRRSTTHVPNRGEKAQITGPVFNFPTIIGRLLNGSNFEPLAGITVELRREGELVRVRDQNWQNPYNLVANTEGTFTFWPYPLAADAEGLRSSFEFSIHVEAAGLETLIHFFSIPVISEDKPVESYSGTRTFRLPDLYMFPPGESGNAYIDAPD
ncbi:MAG: late competence development ComFB family protein [Spirochaetaceae bacterium]|jgi:competence protein ComFB|nr:late competence development ComFB family protein [Spirochaetaceae bacterium]